MVCVHLDTFLCPCRTEHQADFLIGDAPIAGMSVNARKDGSVGMSAPEPARVETADVPRASSSNRTVTSVGAALHSPARWSSDHDRQAILEASSTRQAPERCLWNATVVNWRMTAATTG
jgi:hypothetical protein